MDSQGVAELETKIAEFPERIAALKTGGAEVEDTAEALKQARKDSKVPPVRDQLIALAEAEAELWHDKNERAFATIGDGRSFPVEKVAFARWLRKAYHAKTGKAPTSSSMQDAINAIDCLAVANGSKKHSTHRRVARTPEGIFISLENEDCEVIHVTPERWSIIALKDCPVKLINMPSGAPLQMPSHNGSIDPLWELLNIPEDMRARVLMWLLSALSGTFPYPILAIEGPQGSAKSTVARGLRSLIDPSTVALRGPPKNEEDLAASANNAHVLALDNLSRLDPKMSDALCRVATGAGISSRKYYTQEDECLIEMRCPVIINGITSMLTRSDLAGRSLMVTLKEIAPEDRMTEKKYWPLFKKVSPAALGVLLDGLVYGLANPLDNATPLPRMADVAEWSISCAPVFGYSQGEFAEAVDMNVTEVLQASVEGDNFIDDLKSFITNRGDWSGKAGELLTALARHKGLEGKATPDGYPRSGQGVAGKLGRTKEALAACGFKVSVSTKDYQGSKTYTITGGHRAE